MTRHPNTWEFGLCSIASSVNSIPLSPSIFTQIFNDRKGGTSENNERSERDGGIGERLEGLISGMKMEEMTSEETSSFLRMVCTISSQLSYGPGEIPFISPKYNKIRPRNGCLQACSSWCSARQAYFYLVRDYLMTTLPVFYLPSVNVRVGHTICLNLFEPRSCQLITEQTAGRSTAELSGGLMKQPYPQFIFACRTPVVAGTYAFVVDVIRCRIYSNGRADVMINPTKLVRLDKVEERPEYVGLSDAMFIRP